MALMILPKPIVALLFQWREFDASDTERTAAALAYYAGGLLCFAWVKISVAGFYAVKDTKTPVVVASASMLLNIILCFLLVKPMGFRGLALATTSSYFVNFFLLYVLLCRKYGRLWDAPFLNMLGRITLATAGMTAVLYETYVVVLRLSPSPGFLSRLVWVAAPLLTGALAYVLFCGLLRVPDVRSYLSVFSRSSAEQG
jgi:putative peptidoglycan lipid II flippase